MPRQQYSNSEPVRQRVYVVLNFNPLCSLPLCAKECSGVSYKCSSLALRSSSIQAVTAKHFYLNRYTGCNACILIGVKLRRDLVSSKFNILLYCNAVQYIGDRIPPPNFAPGGFPILFCFAPFYVANDEVIILHKHFPFFPCEFSFRHHKFTFSLFSNRCSICWCSGAKLHPELPQRAARNLFLVASAKWRWSNVAQHYFSVPVGPPSGSGDELILQ